MTSTLPALDVYTEVLQAKQQLSPYIRETPLDYSPLLSELGHCQVFLKLENLQHTGSFKVRGAINTLLSLTAEQKRGGVVAASSGNHGAAVAYGLKRLDIPGVIFVPEDASSAKVSAIQKLGATVQFHGTDCGVTEAYARQYASERGLVYASPYNDLKTIAGQGTIAVEIAQQLKPIDTVFASVGGGGLISGIAGYLKPLFKDIEIIGCSPVNSPVMAESIKAGQLVQMESLPTLSDGTAGGIEPGAITFDLCRTLVDDFVLVTETEIQAAIRLLIENHHLLIEGAAGTAIAAFLQRKEQLRDKTVVIVICGANISLEVLKRIL
ncbi:threonine/serine dehydratase [Oscillatoria sp. FACHB-1407]|uniref:threonine/serine dehydratase n=1 Tax=Oscillatoria sp. FACHB-1407 TaxID=2692847 RepID=UPI001688B5CC|nr:threonine/serine dehydratase [Oscillatoria sp. FACHB-1407]MBD2465837.1 threonine/serine dehydratase [Oscillatoria sp. FACHB-1407]